MKKTNKKIPAIIGFVVFVIILNTSITTSQEITSIQRNPVAPIENQPPEIPIINGTTNGKIGITYNYTFVTTDPDGDDVYYWINWEPGCPAVYWFGPYPSGQVINLSHTFTQKGTYPISCQAKDIYNATGEPGSLNVTMSRSKSINRTFINILQNYVKNYSNLFLILQKLLIKL